MFVAGLQGVESSVAGLQGVESSVCCRIARSWCLLQNYIELMFVAELQGVDVCCRMTGCWCLLQDYRELMFVAGLQGVDVCCRITGSWWLCLLEDYRELMFVAGLQGVDSSVCCRILQGVDSSVCWKITRSRCLLQDYRKLIALAETGSSLSLDQMEQDVAERTDHVKDSTAGDMYSDWSNEEPTVRPIFHWGKVVGKNLGIVLYMCVTLRHTSDASRKIPFDDVHMDVRVIPHKLIIVSQIPLVKKARLPCWPLYIQQVSHQRWIWGICCAQARKHASEGIHPGFKTRGRHQQVQNRSISGPTKSTYVLQKFLKKSPYFRVDFRKIRHILRWPLPFMHTHNDYIKAPRDTSRVKHYLNHI